MNTLAQTFEMNVLSNGQETRITSEMIKETLAKLAQNASNKPTLKVA
jgi:hypothetical protein